MLLLKRILFILVCCFPFISATADNNNGGNTNPPPPETKTVVIKPIKDPSKHPSVPSRIYITCEYCDGYMEFILPQGIESVQVTITNDDFEWIDFVTVDNPVMLLPTLSGVYDIICVTPDGREFGAELFF